MSRQCHPALYDSKTRSEAWTDSRSGSDFRVEGVVRYEGTLSNLIFREKALAKILKVWLAPKVPKEQGADLVILPLTSQLSSCILYIQWSHSNSNSSSKLDRHLKEELSASLPFSPSSWTSTPTPTRTSRTRKGLQKSISAQEFNHQQPSSPAKRLPRSARQKTFCSHPPVPRVSQLLHC